MNSPILNQLGELNPQLYRELKGRLTARNLLLVAGSAYLTQLFWCLFFARRLFAFLKTGVYGTWNNTEQYWEINWQLWSLDLFTSLSGLGILLLLVLGTYQLVSNSVEEQRRGTFDFIRLSPQSTSSLFWGKILGVPALLYSYAVLALPLHLASGLAAGLPLGAIAAFYLILLVSCALIYSAALSYALISPRFKKWQPAIATGTVFLLLSCTLLWVGTL